MEPTAKKRRAPATRGLFTGQREGWDGRTARLYHYHATWDFPYTIGCLRGAWRIEDMLKISGGPPPRRGRP